MAAAVPRGYWLATAVRSASAREEEAVKRQRGFSLIELLIVVAIILIIAAIAVPRFLRARMAANEASAASSLKQVGIADAAYSSVYNIGYAGSLAALGPPPGDGGCVVIGSNCADLLDSLLSGVVPSLPIPIKSGYQFEYFAEFAQPSPGSANSSYAIVATPTTPNSTGQSTFCFDNHIAVFRDTSGIVTTGNASGCAVDWPVGGTINPL